MKNLLKTLLILTFLLVFAAACSSGGDSDTSSDSSSNDTSSSEDSTSSSEGEKLELKMSVTVGETSTWYEAAEKLAKDIEEETDGRITIDIFPNEQLSGGDSGKAVELLSKGQIDLTVNSTIIYSIMDERFGVPSAPFLFNNQEEVDPVFNGAGGAEIAEILREKGVEPLG